MFLWTAYLSRHCGPPRIQWGIQWQFDIVPYIPCLHGKTSTCFYCHSILIVIHKDLWSNYRLKDTWHISLLTALNLRPCRKSDLGDHSRPVRHFHWQNDNWHHPQSSRSVFILDEKIHATSLCQLLVPWSPPSTASSTTPVEIFSQRTIPIMK